MKPWLGSHFARVACASIIAFACSSGGGGNQGAGAGASAGGSAARGGESANGGAHSEGGNAGASITSKGGTAGASTNRAGDASTDAAGMSASNAGAGNPSGGGGTGPDGTGGASASGSGGKTTSGAGGGSSGTGGKNAGGSGGTNTSGTGGTNTSGTGGKNVGGTGGTNSGGTGGTNSNGGGGLGSGSAANGSPCAHGGLCASGQCVDGLCAAAATWGAPITLSSAPGAPSVAMASFGQAVVAWRDDPRDQVLARVAAIKTFGAESRIDTNGGAVSVSDPKVAFTGGQSFVATWSESFSSSNYGVFARAFAATWKSSTDLDGTLSSMQLPRIATNAQGNGAVVWNGRDDSFVWLRNVNGSSFGSAQNFSYGDDQAVAVSPSGRVAAAWCVTVTGTADLWVASYQPGVGWGAPVRAYQGTLGGACYDPAIAIDDAGQMAVTWNDGPSVGRPYARYYSPVSGWESTTLIEANIMYGSYAAAPVFSASGALLLVWYRIDSTTSSCDVRYRLHLGDAWTPDQTLDECRDGSGFMAVATYDQESFRVIYHHKNANSSGRELWDARYVGGQGFRDRRLISAVASVQSAPALALDANGKGLLAFVYRVGTEVNDPSELRAMWLE